MAGKRWKAFPHANAAYDYSGGKLAAIWPKLHAGDQEAFPDEAAVARRIKGRAKLGTDAAAIAASLQDAWRAFHRGDFQDAYEAGVALGPLGASVAVKAGGVHAAHLLDDPKARAARYEELAALAEDAIAALPDDANAHFRRAFALGRYGQEISIVKALKQGIGGKVRESLERALELAPRHAEAHTAMALYHAEIIAKVGAMIGGLTYGAKAASAEKHMATALKLTPDAPIVHIEHANLLLLLHGDAREDEAADAFEKASKLRPRDAMEHLDAAFARDQIEE